MCIFCSMLCQIVIPVWSHACILKKLSVGHLVWYFVGRMEKCSAWEKDKKERNTEISLQNYACTQWMGKQTNTKCVNTYFWRVILTFLSFYVPLSHATVLHLPFKISVPNGLTLLVFSNCTHDITQVFPFYVTRF